jgi:hypothetical protein
MHELRGATEYYKNNLIKEDNVRMHQKIDNFKKIIQVYLRTSDPFCLYLFIINAYKSNISSIFYII